MAKNQPLVSVIVPVYNVEKYLDDCIRSITAQTYSNIEIILVDDGSTDKSGKKCDTWEKKDRRIKVIHKKNEGLNYARRDGFSQSSGEYVTFVDSDDIACENLVQALIEALITNDCDVSVAASEDFTDKDSARSLLAKGRSERYETTTLTNKRDIVRNALLGVNGYEGAYFMTAWGKMFARRLVDKVDWSVSNFRAYEDNFWTPQILCASDSTVLISGKLYLYRRNNRQGETLGSKQIGNSLNGKPVGYLERNELLYEFNKQQAKKYKVAIDDELAVQYKNRMLMLLGNLIESGNLCEENNLEYIRRIWVEHMAEFEERNRAIMTLQEKVARLENEAAAYTGIKRSARLLAGNIKRRLMRL